MHRRHLLRFAGATGLSLILWGAVSLPSLAEQTDLVADTSRVVAIGGAVTEIVYALGEEGKLVARDSTSVYPPAAFTLPDVGYMRALSAEGVLSVNPSAIIALQGSGPKEAVEVLKKASVPYVEVPEDFNHAGIVRRIEVVAHALGVEDKGRSLAAKVDADLAKTEAIAAGIKERKRVLFILSFQDGKILGSGEGTAASGILALAGADNAVGGFQGYKQLTDEAVLEARPDIILMMDRGGGADHSALDAQLLAHPALSSTPAGQAKAIIRMDGAYLLGFGPRAATAARDLATRIYGDAANDG